MVKENRMFKTKRGFIKCPYCANGIYMVANGQNYELLVDGKNELKLMVLNDNGHIRNNEYIPMNYCFMCGRNLMKGGE